MKPEPQESEDKEKYFLEKKHLIEERISLLESDSTDDKLKNNSNKLEILELKSTLEGVIDFYQHYAERVKNMKRNQEELTKECESNYDNYYSVFKSISTANIKQYSNQLQQQYGAIMNKIKDECIDQQEKNKNYALMKEILIRMKII